MEGLHEVTVLLGAGSHFKGSLYRVVKKISEKVVKVGEGPAQEASRRGAIHLVKKLRETERSSEAKRPNVPCSSQPHFSLPFLLQLSSCWGVPLGRDGQSCRFKRGLGHRRNWGSLSLAFWLRVGEAARLRPSDVRGEGGSGRVWYSRDQTGLVRRAGAPCPFVFRWVLWLRCLSLAGEGKGGLSHSAPRRSSVKGWQGCFGARRV